MKFVFEYDVAGKIETVELTISDDTVASAQTAGYDLISVEDIAKHALDQFMTTIQARLNSRF